MKEQTKAIAVRLDMSLLSQVLAFANANGLLNDQGDPNMSAALRLLVVAGLGEGRDAAISQVWNSAKGSAMRELAGRLHAVLQDYRDHE